MRGKYSVSDLTSLSDYGTMIIVTTVHELIAELPEDTEVIPLPDVWRIINDQVGPWDMTLTSHAVKAGAIRALPERGGPNRRSYLVTRDEAVLIIVGAVVAFALDRPVVAGIRAVRGSGVSPVTFAELNTGDAAPEPEAATPGEAEKLPPVTLVCRNGHRFETRAKGGSTLRCPRCEAPKRVPRDRPTGTKRQQQYQQWAERTRHRAGVKKARDRETT